MPEIPHIKKLLARIALELLTWDYLTGTDKATPILVVRAVGDALDMVVARPETEAEVLWRTSRSQEKSNRPGVIVDRTPQEFATEILRPRN